MVRKKSDEKRSQIIRVAAEAFQELGFERTSMNVIAERLGGSKQTLYNYFPSKDELLRAVLEFDVGEVADQAMQDFVAEPDLRKALVGLGRLYLERQLAPAAVSNFRLVVSQAPSSALGEDFYQNILCAAWKRVAQLLGSLMREGQLRRADPWLATMHFKGLVQQDLLERELLGGSKAIDPKEIAAAARHGADAFLTIYGSAASKAAAPKRR